MIKFFVRKEECNALYMITLCRHRGRISERLLLGLAGPAQERPSGQRGGW